MSDKQKQYVLIGGVVHEIGEDGKFTPKEDKK